MQYKIPQNNEESIEDQKVDREQLQSSVIRISSP